jgi:hypothetical protein
MRVNRSGDAWTVSYSFDGTSWFTGSTFNRALTVTGVGMHVGNSSNVSHTVLIDYFHNLNTMPSAPNLAGTLNNIQVLTLGSSAYLIWQTTQASEAKVQYQNKNQSTSGESANNSVRTAESTMPLITDHKRPYLANLHPTLSANTVIEMKAYLNNYKLESKSDGFDNADISEFLVSNDQTQHGVLLKALQPNTAYEYQIIAIDNQTRISKTATLQFHTGPVPEATGSDIVKDLELIESDDYTTIRFNTPGLFRSQLIYSNPQNHAAAHLANTTVVTPGGATSDLQEQFVTEHMFTVPRINPAASQVFSLILEDEKGNVFSIDNVREYILRLKSVGDLKAISSGIPGSYELYQNFPNPFNPSTTLRFDIPGQKASQIDVQLVVFNTLGQKVKELFNGKAAPGSYQVQWDGGSDTGIRVSSGLYFGVLKTNNFRRTVKMVLTK